MTTTVAHPRAGRFSGKAIGMALAGLVLAAGIGYAISSDGGEETAQANVTQSAVDSADLAHVNRAAELAAKRQALLNEATKGVGGAAAVQATPQFSITASTPWYARPAPPRFSITGPTPSYAQPPAATPPPLDGEGPR